jgi:phospholipid/cholesterol/gamma-HCH transport system substrate-binding protein
LKGLTTEAKVGSAVLLGLVILAYMTIKVGGFSFFQENGYRLNVVFNTASGLDKKAPVQISGVEVGRVEEIQLAEGGAKITLKIQSGVKIKRGGYASVRSSGLLGDKFVEIVPGKESIFLKDGDLLSAQQGAPDMENLMNQFSNIAEDVKVITASLREVLGSQEGKQSLKDTLASVRSLTKGINEFVQANRDSLGRSVANFESFSDSLKKNGNELVASLNTMAKKMERGEGTIGKLLNDEEAYNKLNASLDDLGKSLKSVESITTKLERGEGTIGKLLSDDKAYENLNSALEGVGNAVGRIERFKTYVGFRTEYQLQESQYKGYFTLQLQPRADKYYLLEIVDDPRGLVTERTRVVTTDGVPSTITDLETQRRLKITAQFGKRVSNIGLRIGLVENTFGLGADYYLFDDQLRASIDAWEFNSVDPASDRVHMKVTAAYTLFRYLNFEVGYDQMLNERLKTTFVGAGLKFEDDDLKYLLGGLAGLAK